MAAAAATRLARIRKAAATRGIPLAAIVTAVAVVALTSIPAAGALQIVVKELWQATSPGGPLDGNQRPPARNQHPGHRQAG